MNEEMTLTLNSPITDEQWDAITDVDFEHTDRIWFKTKHGKEVEFVKRKKGRWIAHEGGKFVGFPYMHYECNQCRAFEPTETNFCPNCGCRMESGEK